MANGHCTNTLCADREVQLRLARLREELLTNFNSLLLDRINFLEQTINQLSSSMTIRANLHSSSIITTETALTSSSVIPNRVSAPSQLRRSSSTTGCFLPNPANQQLKGDDAGARSCPSSVDLSSINERGIGFTSSKGFLRTATRTASESNANYLSIPMDSTSATLLSDIVTSTHLTNEKGRLESRRFACDVDDNEVRAFKAMVYTEQARKQHTRPLNRLRQVFGKSTSHNSASYTLNTTKKRTNS